MKGKTFREHLNQYRQNGMKFSNYLTCSRLMLQVDMFYGVMDSTGNGAMCTLQRITTKHSRQGWYT